MHSIEHFHCSGGPLDGKQIEIWHEDVFHPSTSSIRVIGKGEYKFDSRAERHPEGWKVLHWSQKPK